MIKEIPVYFFMGFLESGKTTFAKETLVDRGFTDGKRALLLVLEDGEEEYDEAAMKKNKIFVEHLEEEDVTTSKLLELNTKYRPELVLIEYNGTWPLDKFMNLKAPKGWTVVQIISFINAETFDVYMANMKKMMMDQISSADMIIFNRCTAETKRNEYRRSLKAINRRAQVIFESVDGASEIDDEVFLPYDIDQPEITIEDDDFGVFYIDAADNPDKYVGKKVKFKALCFKPDDPAYGIKAFVPGRHAMTCCADDIAFIGFKCYYDKTKELNDREWLYVEGTIKKEYYPEFQGDGPVIYAEKIEKSECPEEELVYFG